MEFGQDVSKQMDKARKDINRLNRGQQVKRESVMIRGPDSHWFLLLAKSTKNKVQHSDSQGYMR